MQYNFVLKNMELTIDDGENKMKINLLNYKR